MDWAALISRLRDRWASSLAARGTGYVYRPRARRLAFGDAAAALEAQGRRTVRGAVDAGSPASVQETLRQAREAGLPFAPLALQPDRYREFLRDAQYDRRYPGYYKDNRAEKTFEHFVAWSLLGIGRDDVFVDLASESSPLTEIAARLAGASCYSQDIMYRKGLHGRRIGGDACAMPVPDGFATRAALTCSLEHFEGDADTRLFRELARVLRPGGKVCVVPFYVAPTYAIQTDPTVSVPAGVGFDARATLFCAEGWGNRHGRFYSPAAFAERVVKPVQGQLAFELLHLANAESFAPSVYARFAFTATRL